MTRPAAKLRRGDQVSCPPFGAHTVEQLEQMPGGTIRVHLSDAIVLIAAPTYPVTILEARSMTGVEPVEPIADLEPVEVVPVVTDAEVGAALAAWFSAALGGAHDRLRDDVITSHRDRMRDALLAAQEARG